MSVDEHDRKPPAKTGTRLIRIRTGLFTHVTDAPDGSRGVVSDEERSILGDGNADGAAPHSAIAGNETSEEVFKGSRGVAVVEGNAYDFIAGAAGAIP